MGNAPSYDGPRYEREPVPSCIPSRAYAQREQHQEQHEEQEQHQEQREGQDAQPEQDARPEQDAQPGQEQPRSELDLEIERITQAVRAGENLLQRLKAKKLEAQLDSLKPPE